MGCKGSEVQILSLRPLNKSPLGGFFNGWFGAVWFCEAGLANGQQTRINPVAPTIVRTLIVLFLNRFSLKSSKNN